MHSILLILRSDETQELEVTLLYYTLSDFKLSVYPLFFRLPFRIYKFP